VVAGPFSCPITTFRKKEKSMNAQQPPLRLLLIVIAVLLVGSLALAVRADVPNNINTLGEPVLSAFDAPEGAGHVIELLARYGDVCETTSLQGATLVASPHGLVEFPFAELGDLSFINIEELPVADPTSPPTFVVTLANNSTRLVRDLDVSLVALLGPIAPDSPTTTVRIAEIPAGATVEVEVTLPVEALAMGRNGIAAVGFQKLIVAIDSRDRFAETNEANNLRLLSRANIAPRIVAVAPPEDSPAPTIEQRATAVAPQQPLDAAIEEFRSANPEPQGQPAQRI
jgi:hypothetical protein